MLCTVHCSLQDEKAHKKHKHKKHKDKEKESSTGEAKKSKKLRKKELDDLEAFLGGGDTGRSGGGDDYESL